MVHLACDGPQPVEFLTYRLCRIFGWTLAEVRAIPLPDLLQLLTCMRVEADHAALSA